MDSNVRNVFCQTNLSELEWEYLVDYVGGDKMMAMATRMFYMVNHNSTHTFDYLVPVHLPSTHPKIHEYLKKAERFMRLLVGENPSKEEWFLAALMAGCFNLHDPEYF